MMSTKQIAVAGMRGILGVLLLTALAARAAPKPAGNEAEIARLRGIFSNELAKLRAAHMQAEAKWEQEYKTALPEIRRQVQLAGDLTGVLAVDNEAKRFAAEKTIPPESLVTEPMALRNLQESSVARKNEIVRQQYENVLKLKDLYIERLSTQVQEHTRAGEIAKAIAVNTEIARARQEPDVTAAEFAMADSSVASETAPTTEPAPIEETTNDSPVAAELPPGVTIAETQTAFADPDHYRMRESVVTGRPAMGAFRIRAWSGKRTHPSEPGAQQDAMRLWIAANRDGQTFTRYVLQVNSFAKKKPPKFSFDNKSELSERLDQRSGYRHMGEMTIPLPPIDKTGVVIDFFPLANPQGAIIGKEALEFSGIVLELLNEKRKTSYRGATLRDLLKQKK